MLKSQGETFSGSVQREPRGLQHHCQLHPLVSVQSRLTLRPHELQHARPPSSSPTPRVYSNSRPFSRWCPLSLPLMSGEVLYLHGSQPFWHQEPVSWKTVFPQTTAWRWIWIQDDSSAVHSLCTFFFFTFFYHYISSTSDHQTLLYPGGWGPLPYPIPFFSIPRRIWSPAYNSVVWNQRWPKLVRSSGLHHTGTTCYRSFLPSLLLTCCTHTHIQSPFLSCVLSVGHPNLPKMF